MKEKTRNFIKIHKPSHLMSLSFLIPFFIMIGIFISKRIYPFGTNSFLRSDMYHQYAPFFAELKHKLTGGGSLFYSFDIGMGANFLSLFGYYLSCPLNFLIIFCPDAYLVEFVSYLVVIKMALAGLTFFYYLSRKRGEEDFGMIFFSTFYALSGFMAAYSWNIMWLDCIILTPLVMLGLERLVNEGKGYLYCITLALAILSNYYIAIMLCLFLVLYFAVVLISAPDNTKYLKRIGQFVFYSLIAGALSACILLPEVYALKMTASAKSEFPKNMQSYFPIYDMIGRHLVGVENEIGLDHWPNIYCGTAVFLMLPLYVANKEISFREKTLKLILIFVLLCSFSFNVPNFIWHGLHFPNSLPARQSFLYIALILSMGYDGYRNIKEAPMKIITGSFWITAAFILRAEKFIFDNKGMTTNVFYISLFFIAMYALFIYLYKKEYYNRKNAATLAFIIVVFESALNMSMTSVITSDRNSFLSGTGDYQTLVKNAKYNDRDFYRFEKETQKTKNDGAWVGYPSASVFSSTANVNLTKLYKKLGMESSVNAYGYKGATPFISSIFDVRYILSDTELPDTELMTLENTSGESYLYRNNYVLPLGFMVPADFNYKWDLSDDCILTQNDFVLSATGTEEVLTRVQHETDGSSTAVTPEKDGYLFAKITDKNIREVTADINGSGKSFSHVERGYLLDLGYCRANEKIILAAESGQTMSAEVYRLNEKGLAAFVMGLNDEVLSIEAYSDTYIRGTVNAQNDGLLFTSIPYDEGWKVEVDGKNAEIELCGEALISVPLSKGTHTIEFHYTVNGLNIGLLISFSAILTLVLVRSVEKKREEEKEKIKNLEKEE